MSFLETEAIPGYAEASRKEQESRDLAFCEWPVPLCGIEAKQFTLTHLLILGNCENAFVSGRVPEPADVAFFLWVVSTDYVPNAKERDKFLARICDRVKFVPACGEIMDYLDAAFADAPAGPAEKGKSYTSFAAVHCDLFASEYGWDDQQTMHKPVARLFQLLRRIQKRHNPRAIQFNRSDRVISDYLRSLRN